VAVNLIATTVGALNFLTAAYDWQQTHVTGVWHVHLFTNSHTVTDASTLASFTEAAWPGYSAATPTWTTPATVSGVPTSTSSTITFTQTSAWPSTNYGMYVTDSTNLKLLGAANFSTPVVLTNSQPSYALTVSITFKPEF